MVVDERTNEIYNDIIEISDILLNRIYASGYDATNDTAHGRIINQLLWFKQEIQNENLKLPLDRNDRASISYIYTHGNINDIDDAEYLLSRLMKLTNNELIIKAKHYPGLINKINQLLAIIENSPRPLTEQENLLLSDLKIVIPKLESEEIVPKKDFKRDDFTGLWFSYSDWDGSSLDDIPGAGELIKVIQEGLVEGVRIEEKPSTV